MKQPYKVVITTSGIGSRLGELTRYVNKALVRVGKKAAVSYIIENIPLDVPIVVTLGYKKEQVKEYLLFAHPERLFEFVDIDPFQGEGSSLGFSLLTAASHLQCPFLFIASDTLFTMPVQYPANNWMGIAASVDASQYTSVRIGYKGEIQEIQNKGALEFEGVYIGLCGVRDYAAFWESLQELYDLDPKNQALNDTRAFAEMMRKGHHFQPKWIENWLDIGNQEALSQARKKVPDAFDNLEKLDESIYLFDEKFVLKFFHNPAIIQKRIHRADCLKELVPKIQKKGHFFYSYEYVQGHLYSRSVSPQNFPAFLKWCQSHLWRATSLSPSEQIAFHQHCENFYRVKTLERIQKFYQSTKIKDEACTINQIHVPSLQTLLEEIDWEAISEGTATGFHGDLHFENILQKEDGFYLLDWRQDFDGLIEYGDMYYDLAKLNHGMIISHEIVRKNLFEIKIKNERVECEILRPDNHVLCQEQFYRFIEEERLDRQKIDVLTALIFLNIAPLHHHPYNLFLHFFGRLRLWAALRLNSKTKNNMVIG